MRYSLLLLFTALLISACSSTKEIEFTSLNQQACQNQMNIDEQNQFAGETVDSLIVYQEGETIYAKMDVRSYCNSQFTFSAQVSNETIKLKLSNANNSTDDCVCVKQVTTSFKNVEPGFYNIMITNSAGTQLLDQTSLNIK